MTEHKFTDEEIIRALECCRDFGDCSLCPYAGATFEDEPDCAEKMHTDALDLINRQKAEIERLRKGILLTFNDKQLEEIKNECLKSVEYNIREISTVAIKELAERFENELTEKVEEFYFEEEHENFLSTNKVLAFLDNLVKEMTEGI